MNSPLSCFENRPEPRRTYGPVLPTTTPTGLPAGHGGPSPAEPPRGPASGHGHAPTPLHEHMFGIAHHFTLFSNLFFFILSPCFFSTPTLLPDRLPDAATTAAPDSEDTVTLPQAAPAEEPHAQMLPRHIKDNPIHNENINVIEQSCRCLIGGFPNLSNNEKNI